MTRREFGAEGIGFFATTLQAWERTPGQTPGETPRNNSVWIEASADGEVKHLEWPGANKAVSVGSLLKPFLALAYLQSGKASPIVECRGAVAGCWKASGHGRQDLVNAIAHSCNVYFLQLASAVNRAALDSVCLSYGLGLAERDWTASRLIGVGAGWPQTPYAVVRAFASLSRDAGEPTLRPVLAGMELCARAGTAQACGFACYAKTGTAECSHGRGGLGDGYAVALYPAGRPRHSLLVMRHNTTGAKAAGALGQIRMSLV